MSPIVGLRGRLYVERSLTFRFLDVFIVVPTLPTRSFRNYKIVHYMSLRFTTGFFTTLDCCERRVWLPVSVVLNRLSRMRESSDASSWVHFSHEVDAFARDLHAIVIQRAFRRYRRAKAAEVIQRVFREAIANPRHPIGFRRLAQEYLEYHDDWINR